MYEKLDYKWAAGRLEANTLLSFKQINQSSLALCLQATKRLILLKLVLSGYQISKWKKKGLIDLQDSYEDRLFLLNVHLYDEFHVPDVLVMLLHMWRRNS